MDDKVAPALELTAEAVAAAPLLGYLVVDVAGHGGLQVSQPWIEIENDPVTVDLELFSDCRPLDGLLFDGSVGSGFVTSLSVALADFRDRWATSSQLHDRVGLAAGEALIVDGGDAEVVVWREGMVIGAHEPLATALRLLTADFSEAARQKYVSARPQLLQSALSLLPDDVKSRYVPEAGDFVKQAHCEMHELVVRKQQRLKERAPKFKDS
jgi:hypothetical protein